MHRKALQSPARQAASKFSWRLAIKEFFLIVVLTFLVGGAFNYSLLLMSFDGTLKGEIQQKQLAELKAKTAQLSPDISFVDLVSAKKLYDDGLAVFLDARSPDDFARGHLPGAVGLPVTSVVAGGVELETVLPDKGAVLVTYCDGGECDLSVELAKELIDRGYSNVFVFGEGYPGWEEAGYPVEKWEV